MAQKSASSYDEIAGMYHVLWADWYLPAAMPALECLFFSRTPTGARVLDLCCGSGHVTKELISRGYRVTGVDKSPELIELARRDLPGTDLRVQDATDLHLEEQYDAVLSTFDSLNHILNLDDLRKVFLGVHAILKPGGLFLFDMNLEEAYSTDQQQWTVDITDRWVGLVRGIFNRASKTARTELIWFVRTLQGDLWQRHHSVVEQQCYPQSQILLTLAETGFQQIEAMPSRSAGVNSDLGFGRVFFSAASSLQE